MGVLKSYSIIFVPRCMTLYKTILHYRHKLYSVLMLLALAWLTVSLPFVYADQQAQKEAAQKQYATAPIEEDNSSLNNTTEEKTSSNTLSEYLHDAHTPEHPGSLVIKSYKLHFSDIYIAFHPESICPPPDRIAS